MKASVRKYADYCDQEGLDQSGPERGFGPSGGRPALQRAKGAVSRQMAEDALGAAFEALARLPDRQAAWLRAGERSGWPEVVRDAFEAYGADDGDADRVLRSASGTRRDVARAERLLLDEKPLFKAIGVHYRALVAHAVLVRRQVGLGRFTWQQFYIAHGGRMWSPKAGRVVPTTKDYMRVRFGGEMEALGDAMDADGWLERWELG